MGIIACFWGGTLGTYGDIESDYHDFLRRGRDAWGPFWQTANIGVKGCVGDNWTEQEKESFREQGRCPLEFNIIRPKINFYSGYVRDNLKSVIVKPQEDQDRELADDHTESLKYIYNKGNGNPVQLKTFDDGCKAGMSLAGIQKDYTHSPINGDIVFYNRPYNSFYIDPNFRCMDLSDASEVVLRDVMDRERVKRLLPFVDPKVIDEVPKYINDQQFGLRSRPKTFMMNRDLVSYDSYYRMITRKQKCIVDLDTDVIQETRPEVTDEELDFLMMQAMEAGINVDIMELDLPYCELNVVLSGQCVYSGDNEFNLRSYPFAPFICYFETQYQQYDLMIQGLSLGLVDAQRQLNKRMVRIEDVMDSAVNQGYFYRAGEVDVEDAVISGATRWIPVKNTTDLDRDLREVRQGQVPQGWSEQPPYIQQLATEISGVNESLQGMDEGGNTQVSGSLAEIRVASGVRANRSIFDNFEQFQRILGGKVLEAYQRNYSKGKVAKILGKPVEEVSDELFSIQSARFDTTVGQGVLSQTQEEATYYELLRAQQIMGDSFPTSILVKKFPFAGASELQEAYEQQQEQQMQAAQEAQDFERELQFRNLRLQEALTTEKISESQMNKAESISKLSLGRERESEAVQNVAKARLDNVKAIQEIQGLRQENVLKVLQFVDDLRERDRQAQLQTLQENATIVTALSKGRDSDILAKDIPAQQQPNGGINGNV